MRKLWLVTTDHLEEDLWFRDDEDFRVGMNLVAVQAACCPDVVVLAFILMSNHVHFVLSGSRWEVEAFVQQFKHRYSIYYSRRWGIREFLRLKGVDFKEIPYEDEAPERAIAYVQMNCVAANICGHPSQYPYGTGDVFLTRRKLLGSGLEICPPAQGSVCCIPIARRCLRIGAFPRRGLSCRRNMWT